MSKHRSQVRSAPALLYAYPVHGHNALRPSGSKDDPPEIERDYFYKPMTPDEQRDWDSHMARHPRANDKRAWAYWDRVRYLKRLSPRARKRALAREAKKLKH